MTMLPQDAARALANSLGALETSEADARELSPAEVASLVTRNPAPDASAPLVGTPSIVVQVRRNAHMGGDSYEASMLRNLLARIFGDGGHYLAQHGLDKALDDADKLVADWRAQQAPRGDLTETALDAAQSRAIEALLAIPGWRRDEDWFDRGETHEDDREAAAGLEGYRS